MNEQEIEEMIFDMNTMKRQMTKSPQLRPFEDLIKPIKYNGETFVPIEEIAKLATIGTANYRFNFSKPLISKVGLAKISMVVFCDRPENVEIKISSAFNTYLNDLQEELSIINQVQIVKNLIKWGFVEP